MEERSIWLPAGLESPGLEPDDRASQRSELSSGGRSDRGPRAAGEQGPYDQERPETKRGRSKPDSAEGEEPAGSKKRTESRAQQRATKSVKAKGSEPKAPAKKRPKPAAKQRPEQRTRSDVDAMGQEKHREVVGKQYGLSRGRQFLYYGIALAFVVAAYIGLRAAAHELDKAPAHDPDQAPWSQPGAPQGPLGGFEPREPGQKGPADFQ